MTPALGTHHSPPRRSQPAHTHLRYPEPARDAEIEQPDRIRTVCRSETGRTSGRAELSGKVGGVPSGASRAGVPLAGSTGLEPAASGVTGASLEARTHYAL